MKQTKKILCILLILSSLVVLLAGCGDRGEIIAVYNNTPVYEEDVKDIINYYIATNATLESTEEEKSEMAKEAVRTYVRYKLLEIDLKEKGYTIDEKALKQSVEDTIAYLDENFEGGYKDWRTMYLVSKDFLKEDLRRYELANLFNEYASDMVEVTDEEIQTYYNGNWQDYMAPAGYTWTAVLLEVLDLGDEEECAAAKAEAENYIRQINSGYTTLEKVKEDILKKYTEEDGYTQTALYSGENFSAKTDVKDIPDLAAALKEVEANYENLNPDAEPDTDEYKTYMKYLGECFQTEVYYALQNMEVGDIYSKPLLSFAGYFIIRLDKVKTTNDFTPIEDVRDEIETAIRNEKVTEMFTTCMDELEEKYDVQYLFDLPVS